MTQRRLEGKTIFLSASVPKPERGFTDIDDAAFQIEQAIICLARAVFAEGGHLLFGGHPSISPLIATVAGEFHTHRSTRDKSDAPVGTSLEWNALPLVTIFQSEAFREVATEGHLLLFKLGSTKVVWTAAVNKEKFDPRTSGRPCPDSVRWMQREMVTAAKESSIGMVCIGGMEGVIDEVELFETLCPERHIFILARTGGAAKRLAEIPAPNRSTPDLDLQAEIGERVARRLEAGDTSPFDDAETAKNSQIPYPLVMERIATQLSSQQISPKIQQKKDVSVMPDTKHLEFLQSAVERMANASFVTKGWNVTLATALIGFTVKDSDPRLALVGLLPIFIFWGLDAYFLALERRFRDKYNDAAERAAASQPATYDMKPKPLSFVDWFIAGGSPAVLPVHLCLILAATLAYILA